MVEILVVSAILVLIATIMLPVLTRARGKALDASGMSNLRQLSLAGTQYVALYDEFPGSTRQLVAANLVPTAICASPYDPVPKGLANWIVSDSMHTTRDRALVAPYKSSYAGHYEFSTGPEIIEYIQREDPMGGWLVDLTVSDRAPGALSIAEFEGAYRRVLYEGGVVKRRHRSYECRDGDTVGPCRSPQFLFTDLGNRIDEALVGLK